MLMLRRFEYLMIMLLCLLLVAPSAAQDGLNLPADLYVLVNGGQIRRYGVGTSGVTDLTPASLFIIDFGVDSLGERIAFRTESGLFVINVASGGQPQQIEGVAADVPPYRGSGDTIAWSPNGDGIAYTTTYGARVYFDTGGTAAFVDLKESIFKSLRWSPGGRFLAAEAEIAPNSADSVWWIYRRDGYDLVLTSIIPSSIGTAWVSDSEIVFAPAEGGLRLMSLDQANAQAVLLDELVVYRLPAINAQDALVFFGRDPNDENVPDGYGRLLQLARGAQQLQTIGAVPISLSGLRWAPGGSLLVAFQGGVIALYDPSTGLGFPLPIENVVAYAWGPVRVNVPAPTAAPPTDAPILLTDVPIVPTAAPSEPPTELPPTPALEALAAQPTPVPVTTVTALNLSADSFFLAPDSRGVVQVWKMRAGGTPPQPFTRSGTDVNEYAVSPDGSSVVYGVDAELWLQVSSDQPKLLARLNSFAPIEAAFSADGTQLVYVDERSGVWLNVLAENAPQLIRANGSETYHRPQFSPDGTHLLLDVYDDAGVSMGIFDVAARNLITLPPASPDDPRPVQTHWLRDGRIYTIVDSGVATALAPGFYIFDAAAPATAAPGWIALPGGTTVRASTEAVAGTLRALIADGTSTFAPLRVVDFDLAGGNNTPILDIGSLIAPQISPDGRFVSGYDNLTEIDSIRQGAITVVDLRTGQRFQLSSPETAWDFRWGGAS